MTEQQAAAILDQLEKLNATLDQIARQQIRLPDEVVQAVHRGTRMGAQRARAGR